MQPCWCPGAVVYTHIMVRGILLVYKMQANLIDVQVVDKCKDF